MPLLKWLQQQPSCEMTASGCEEALSRRQSKIVRFLVAELQPPVFPAAARVLSTRGACFLVLAQAACPMAYHQLPNLKQLLEAWYTFMGLQHCAANQTELNAVNDGPLQLGSQPHNEGRCLDEPGASACSNSSHSSSLGTWPRALTSEAKTIGCNVKVQDGCLMS